MTGMKGIYNHSMYFPLYLLVWLCIGVWVCNAQTVSLAGAGSLKFSDIPNLYQLVDSSTQFQYTQTSLSQAKTQFSLSRVDFLITQTPLLPAEHTMSDCSSVYDVREFPLNLDGLVLIYSIPGIDTQSSSTSTLILNRQVVVDIYTGNITKWNDPSIVALNPDLASVLPDATFTPYYIADSSMSDVFSAALSSFSQEWKDAQASAGAGVWPFIATAVSNDGGKGPDNMVATVLASGSAIGFSQYSTSSTLSSIARMYNKAGTLLTISKTAMSAAVTDYLAPILSTLNQTNANPYEYPASVLIIVDGGGTNSWPFAHFNMLTTRTNSFQDCLKAKSMYNLLSWLLVSPVVAQQWGLDGNALVPSDIVSILSNVVSKMSCCQKIAGGGTAKTAVNGEGTAYTSTALQNLMTLFNSLSYDFEINYKFADDGYDDLNDNQIDFVLSASLPDFTLDSFNTFPLIGGAIVIIYNVPGVADLSLSVDAMVNVFSGQTTNWNQLDASYPNQSINVILSANSDVAAIFRKMLGASTTFASSTDAQTLSTVNQTSYSIGIVSLTPSVLAITTVSVANYNSGFQTIVPTNTTALSVALMNSSDPTGWPLTSYSYITFKVDANSYCPTLENIAQFVYWIYSDASALNSLQLSQTVRPITSVSDSLHSITCGGTAILNPRLELPGAGSTFAAGVYMSWLTSYAFVDDHVEFTYAGTGSGAGVTSITSRSVVWAGSDAPLTSAQASAGGDLQLYPSFAGSVVLAYRIDALGSSPASLNLTREVIVDIYLGRITMWNDQSIQDLNPEVASLLPAASIVLVYRSDSSGTTNIFTTALKSFSSDWTATGTKITWPVSGITGSGSSGVGLRIFSTANSLGYVELSYASANSLAYSRIKNKAGYWVTPTVTAIQSAMSDYKNNFNPDFTCSIVDGPGKASWPIAAYTYMVLHSQSMSDLATAQKMLEFFIWGVTSSVGAQRVTDLGFSPLPDSFVDGPWMSKLRQVRVNGVSVLGDAPSSKDHHLALGLGVGLGVGIPLIIIIIILIALLKQRRRRRRILKKDMFDIEATEWDDGSVELQPLSDSLGIRLGTAGHDLLTFGIAKGSRCPVMQSLTEVLTLTNESSTDKNFAFYVPKDENRFKLTIVPGYGALKPGAEMNVEVRFTLLMTTTIERKVKFEVLGSGEQAIPLTISGDVSTRLDPNEIDILGKPIGQGAFGTVYRGTYRGTQVAVKVLARQNELLKAQTEEFLKEIDLMHKLRSPFIVGFIGASYVPGKLCVLTEFMEKGSVSHMMRKIRLEHVQRVKIAFDCAQAMAFLHNNGVMHRDLKPANLLVMSLSSSAEVSVKLADFGTSRSVTHIYANGKYTNGWGTPGYMAPELLAKGEYSGKVDVYAYGIMLLELYTQKDPYSFMKKVWDLPDFVCGGNRPEIPDDCPPEYTALIKQCWAQHPVERPSFPDLCIILEPMFVEERIRAKETKRRLLEAGITPPKATFENGSYQGSSLSNTTNNTTNNLTNNALSNTRYSNNRYSGRLSNRLSEGGSDSPFSDRKNSGGYKGKDKNTNEMDRMTSFANMSNDSISEDRKMYFVENKE